MMHEWARARFLIKSSPGHDTYSSIAVFPGYSYEQNRFLRRRINVVPLQEAQAIPLGLAGFVLAYPPRGFRFFSALMLQLYREPVWGIWRGGGGSLPKRLAVQ